MSLPSGEDGPETIPPRKGIANVLSDLGTVLDSPVLEPAVAGVAAAQLETATYDLALAVIRLEDSTGDRAEVQHMRDSLQEIESRLVWVQKNRFDADRGRTRDELREACDRALDILALLAQNGITLDEVEPGAGRNLGIQGQ